MFLLDQIGQSEGVQRVQHLPTGQVFELTSPSRFAPALRACPSRFVFDAGVTRACYDLVERQGDLLSDCLDLLRFPAERLWLEWREPAGALGAPTDQPRRVGAYVECSPEGRRGTMRIFWENPSQPQPDVAPLTIRFDFDRPLAHEDGGDALAEMTAAARYEIDAAWMDYHRAAGCPQRGRESALATAGFDFPLAAGFCFLMGAVDFTRRQPSELSRLNAARAKARRPELLEHVEVSLDLAALPAVSAEAASGQGRRASRIHHVRGHFVRRRDAIFWRRPHLRGSAALGRVATRTVSVRMSTPSGGAARRWQGSRGRSPA